MRCIAMAAAAVRVSTPSLANTRSRCFFTVAGLGDPIIYVIDVAAGEKIPRKGGPGITKSDLAPTWAPTWT